MLKIEDIIENEWYIKVNNTKTNYPENKTISSLFEEQVERTPNNIAVINGKRELTYEQLNKKANQIARVLLDKGIGPNNVVGVMTEPSLEMIIGILGILKSGAAYLPIDLAYPEDRIRYMIMDSNVKILLVNKEIEFSEDIDCEQIDLTDNRLYNQGGENIRNSNSPNNLFYVIYTSGSTGKPKGVKILQYAFVNLINWFIKEFNISSEDHNLLIASISFDLAQKNLFATILKGGQLFLSEASPYNYNYMSEVIYNNKITLINCTPSAFYPFIEYNINTKYYRLESLRYVFLGGENINKKNLVNIYSVNNCEFINTYGPTECTDIVAYYRIKNEDFDTNVPIPIGKPINNTRLYILDENNNLLPPNMVGELYVGGVGVSPGYYNNDSLTKDKFLNIEQVHEDRLYRTGDRAKWLPDGNIELVGRDDYQVKLRGYRIELGEIETAILGYNCIKGTVVDVKEREDGSKYLRAFVIADENFTVNDVKKYLSEKLPEYMIPSSYIKVDKFPLTSNGKIDRIAINKIEYICEPSENENRSIEDNDLDDNSIRSKVRRIYRDCTMNSEVDKINDDDDLSVLNIDSLLFIKIIVTIEDEFDFEFDDNDMVMNKFLTFNNMITYIESKIAE